MKKVKITQLSCKFYQELTNVQDAGYIYNHLPGEEFTFIQEQIIFDIDFLWHNVVFSR